MKVDAQLKACLEEIGEEEGSCSDETLVMLIWSYDWLYRSGLFEQIKELASTALSWFDLDEDDHEKIEEAMEGEEPEARFHSIQWLYLQHARRLWQNGKERAGGCIWVTRGLECTLVPDQVMNGECRARLWAVGDPRLQEEPRYLTKAFRHEHQQGQAPSQRVGL